MQVQKKIVIETPEDVYNLFKDEMKDLKQECFKVLLLTSRNNVIKCETVALGTLDETIVHPRDVFRVAIKNNAAYIILVHNHPSGDPEPGYDDIEITKKLVDAGKLLGIKILDHIIIGDGKFINLKTKI